MRLTTEKTHDPIADRLTLRIRTVRRWERSIERGWAYGRVIGQVTKQGKTWAWRKFSLDKGEWQGDYETMQEAMKALAKVVK